MKKSFILIIASVCLSQFYSCQTNTNKQNSEKKPMETSYNKTDEEWRKILSKMVIAFELLVKDNGTFDLTKKEMKKYDKGMKLFHEYFLNLWN